MRETERERKREKQREKRERARMSGVYVCVCVCLCIYVRVWSGPHKKIHMYMHRRRACDRVSKYAFVLKKVQTHFDVVFFSKMFTCCFTPILNTCCCFSCFCRFT